MFNVSPKNMNNIKNLFNIKDLENLSGIKAHTIRIWEKRYGILEPLRTETNIRYYDVHNLQKLLNISTLNSFGYKISVLAKLPPERLPQLVKEVISNKSLVNHVVNNFKLAMMNFDQTLFLSTYESISKEKTYREIFYEFFIPLLDEIGFLWQTDTITPAHEHFISHLIKQKLASCIEQVTKNPPTDNSRTYILYLPMNEIHEIGLMFIHYELVSRGLKSIYLGECVPTGNLVELKNYFHDITFVTYMTVSPAMESVNGYVNELNEKLLKDSCTQIMIFGHNSQYAKREGLPDAIKIHESIESFTSTLDYQ